MLLAVAVLVSFLMSMLSFLPRSVMLASDLSTRDDLLLGVFAFLSCSDWGCTVFPVLRKIFVSSRLLLIFCLFEDYILNYLPPQLTVPSDMQPPVLLSQFPVSLESLPGPSAPVDPLVSPPASYAHVECSSPPTPMFASILSVIVQMVFLCLRR